MAEYKTMVNALGNPQTDSPLYTWDAPGRLLSRKIYFANHMEGPAFVDRYLYAGPTVTLRTEDRMRNQSRKSTFTLDGRGRTLG